MRKKIDMKWKWDSRFLPDSDNFYKNHFFRNQFVSCSDEMRTFVGKKRFDLWSHVSANCWLPCLRDLRATSVSQESLGYIGSFLNQSMEQVLKEFSLGFWLRDSEASLCDLRDWITHSLSVPGSILTFCSLSVLLHGESLSLSPSWIPAFVVFLCVTWAGCDGQRRQSVSSFRICFSLAFLPFWMVSSPHNCSETQSRSCYALDPRDCSQIFLGL